MDVQSDQRETLDDIKADYRERFSYFFEQTEIPEGQEYTPQYEEQPVDQVLSTPPPILDNMPETENRSWFTGGFKSLGKRIWSLFGR